MQIEAMFIETEKLKFSAELCDLLASIERATLDNDINGFFSTSGIAYWNEMSTIPLYSI